MKKWKWNKRQFGRICRAAALTAALAALAAGCGEDEKVMEGSVQNLDAVKIESEGGADGAEGQEGQTDTQAQDGEGQEGNASGAAAQKGYLFTASGVTIAMDVDAAPLLAQLGEPASYFEAASCAFEGLDKKYTYNGFELDTYPQGEKDCVSMVIIKDDSVTTKEGVTIGDSLEKLQQAYPEGGKEEDGMIVYEKDSMKLCFIMQGEEIAAIEYRSTVLEQ